MWHKNIRNANLENICPQCGSHEVTAAKQSFKKWAREKSGLKEAFQSHEIGGFRTESCPLSIGIPCCTSYRYQWKLPQNMGRDWPCNFGCCLIWFSFPYACINGMYLFTKTYSVGTTHRFTVCVCVWMWVCAHECRCLWNIETPTELELQAEVNHFVWMLGAELGPLLEL